MFKQRFLWKLFLSYALIVVVTAGVIGVLVHSEHKKNLMESIRENLAETAGVLSGPARLFFRNRLSVGTMVPDSTETNVRVTLVSPEGAVLADSHNDESVMENHANRPEILDAIERGIGISERSSETTDTDMIYLVRAIRDDAGALMGLLRVAIPLDDVQAKLSALRSSWAMGLIAGVLVALGVGVLVARRLMTPIHRMTEAAEAMRKGDYTKRVQVRSAGEMRVLADTLNQLAAEVTERISTLSKEKAQFQAMLTGMIEGVVAVDDMDRVLFCNDAARQLLGVSDLGRTKENIWQLTRLEQLSEMVEKARSQPGTVRREIPVLHGHGRRVLDAQAASFWGGDASGVIVVFHDISELRRLERVRQDFVANASHELKTPLTAIKGYVETLMAGALFDSDNNMRFLGKINAQVDQLTAQVHDLLHLARIESSDSRVPLAPVNVVPLVEEVLQSHEMSLKGKRLRLEKQFGDPAMRVLGDEKALAQVAHNLIDNAIKYTPAEGGLTVRLRHGGSFCELEVEDTGIGIPQRDMSRIFERFYRVDKGRSRDAGGTGLGLSIVKHLVQAMQGEIIVDSRLHHGTRFTVRLPLSS